MLRTLALSAVAALFLGGTAYACPVHDTVAQNKTPVDYAKLQPKQVAEVPIDLWLIDYLEAWKEA